jgi:hypothetical protein
MTFLAMRRGAWVIPKYMKGRPTDELGTELTSRLPWVVQRAMYKRLIDQIQGPMEEYGLPTPDHKLGEAHPTISSDLLSRIGHGRITPKPNIEGLEAHDVRFADGSVEQVDTIVYCTGYKITFPFLSPELLDTAANRVRLYRRVVHPERSGLYFIGLVQPLGAIMPIAERQSEWIADVIEGKVDLPTAPVMERVIEREDERMRKRYVASTRHTIQVDHRPYMRTIARERRRRRRRGARDRMAGRSQELRLTTPAG